MKRILCVILCFSQWAGAVSNDRDNSDSVKNPVPVEKMRYQFEIKGEILVFDSTGRRLLYKVDEGRRWKFGDNKPIVSNWSYKQKDLPPIYLQHVWELKEDGQLKVKIKQVDSMEWIGDEEPKLGKLIKEKEIGIENFESVSWVVSQDSSKRVVAKFEIIYWVGNEPTDVGRLPINSTRMTIFDNKGNVWASRLDNSQGDNIFYAVTTHMGTIYMSYAPFAGAKELGFAEKSRIVLNENNMKVFVESADVFLPRGVTAKVYGFFDLNRRTEKLNSVRAHGTDREENFLTQIKK